MLMVDDWHERLGLNDIIGQLKSKGIVLDALLRGMMVDQPGDNFSILQASEWMNRLEIREHYEIGPFNPKTLYRAVEMVGQNREKRIYALQDAVLKLLGGPKTDVLLDWTSIVYYGDMAKLAKYGYSRDHHPGERQLTLGVASKPPSDRRLIHKPGPLIHQSYGGRDRGRRARGLPALLNAGAERIRVLPVLRKKAEGHEDPRDLVPSFPGREVPEVRADDRQRLPLLPLLRSPAERALEEEGTGEPRTPPGHLRSVIPGPGGRGGILAIVEEGAGG